MDDFSSVEAYRDATDQWPGVIRALRPLLLDAGLTEEIKWGKPCYCLDGANVVLIQEFSDHLALMFFKGVLLDDANGVLHDQGPNSHAAKRMVFTSMDEVEELADAVTAYVAEAIAHERSGRELPARRDETVASELEDRLASDAAFAEAFDNLTPGRRREYNLHVSNAKQAATRERRVDQIVPRVLLGKGLRDR